VWIVCWTASQAAAGSSMTLSWQMLSWPSKGW
jgi:hypothetical protein